MPGFSSEIPTSEFSGAEIELIVIGSSSVKFELSGGKSILLYYYGALEDRSDWLYNLPLCGTDSVQSLVGQKIIDIVILSEAKADILLSEGRVLRLEHDNTSGDLVRFCVHGAEYIA